MIRSEIEVRAPQLIGVTLDEMVGRQAAALATDHGVGDAALLGAVCATLLHRLTDRNAVTVAIARGERAGSVTPVRLPGGVTFRQVLDQFRGSPPLDDDLVGSDHDAVVEDPLPTDEPTLTAFHDAAFHDIVQFRVDTGRGRSLNCRLYSFSVDPDSADPSLLAERLKTLLGELIANPDRPLHRAEIVGPGEKNKILGFSPSRGRLPDVPTHEVICRQAMLIPDRIALRDETAELTYAQMMDEAALIASRLRAAGIGPDSVVGLCAERSLDMVVAVVAILLSGAAYLPLDAAHPRSRLELMLDTAGATALLVSDLCRPAVESATGPPVFSLAGVRSDEHADGQRPPPLDWRRYTSPAPVTSGLAYVMFTSGSTGQPKGVQMTHRSLANRLIWMQDAYRLTGDDVVLQKTPYTFDVSVWELLWPLMYGARLVIAAPDAHRDPQALIDVIRRERVTTVHFVPSMLALFVDEPGLDGCTSLRNVICSGEVLPPKTVNRLMAALPVEVHNLYGPTEAAIDVTAWHCRRPEPDSGVPIGRPISNVAVYLLDEEGRLVPVGSRGEMHLGGNCLARGYCGNPQLTAERFVEIDVAGYPERVYRTGDLAWWTHDGYLHYVGRMDNQVKIRGQRVELGEIETVLHTHPLVRNAVVVLRDESGTVPTLVAYVVPEPGATAGSADERSLREYLAARLPDYMVPLRYVRLAHLPTTANGKIDRNTLPAPPRRQRKGTRRLGGPEVASISVAV